MADAFAGSFFRSRAGMLAYAQRMLEYFDALSAQELGDERWPRGAAATRRWLARAAQDAPAQRELEALLGEMRSERSPGSMFCGLYRRIDPGLGAGGRIA